MCLFCLALHLGGERGFSQVASVLDANSSDPVADLDTLARVTKQSIATEAKHWNVNADRMTGEAVALAEQVLEHAAAIKDPAPGVRELVEKRSEAFLKS